jgi:hypothetical protein
VLIDIIVHACDADVGVNSKWGWGVGDLHRRGL